MNPGRSKNGAQGRPPRHDVTPDRRAGVPTPNPSQGQSPTDALARRSDDTDTHCCPAIGARGRRCSSSGPVNQIFLLLP